MKINEIEFHLRSDGAILWHSTSEPEEKRLSVNDENILSFVEKKLKTEYRQAYEALSELYSVSRVNRSLHRYKIVCRFIRCNFGRNDLLSYDIDRSGRFRFEEVPCPLRGTGDCQLDGIVCKPKYTSPLSDREVEVLALIARGLESEEIAERLNLSKNTIGRHRYNITVKADLHSTAEMVIYYLNNFVID